MYVRAVATVTALALLAGCGGEETSSVEPPPGAITLAEQGDSGESGFATMTGSLVVIELEGAPSTPQPAHIHAGTCAELGVPIYKLTDVTDGMSRTELDNVDLIEPGGSYAINVHESYDEIDTYVACGDLP